MIRTVQRTPARRFNWGTRIGAASPYIFAPLVNPATGNPLPGRNSEPLPFYGRKRSSERIGAGTALWRGRAHGGRAG